MRDIFHQHLFDPYYWVDIDYYSAPSDLGHGNFKSNVFQNQQAMCNVSVLHAPGSDQGHRGM